MGWLARLLGQERPDRAAPVIAVAPRSVQQSEPTAPNWAAEEVRLHVLFAADLRRFAAAHPNAVFYGFGADCNAETGELLLCANTLEDLHEAAVDYTGGGTDKEVAEEKDDIRWQLGYWAHHGLEEETDDDAEPDMFRYGLPRLRTPLRPGERDALLSTICRALLRLADDGSLQLLKRTPDFQLVCVERGEDFHEGEQRMRRARRSMG